MGDICDNILMAMDFKMHRIIAPWLSIRVRKTVTGMVSVMPVIQKTALP